MHAAAIERQRRATSFVLVERVGPRTVERLIAAAAWMAVADGRADPAEREELMAFIRQRGLLGVFGRQATLDRFARVLGRAEPPALAALRPLAGTAAARLVEAAALRVAAADGMIVPAELALLRRLREALGIPTIAAEWV
jgi:tellurite resistance protein